MLKSTSVKCLFLSSFLRLRQRVVLMVLEQKRGELVEQAELTEARRQLRQARRIQSEGC